MKKVISLLALATLTALGCGKTTTTKPVEPPKAAPEPEGRKVPEGWKEIKTIHTSYLVPANWKAISEKTYEAPGGLARAVFGSDKTSLSVMDYVKASLGQLPETITVKLVKPVTVDGNDGVITVMTTEETFIISLTIGKDGTVYNLMCGGPLFAAKASLPVCEAILSSFTVK